MTNYNNILLEKNDLFIWNNSNKNTITFLAMEKISKLGDVYKKTVLIRASWSFLNFRSYNKNTIKIQ